MRGEIFVLKENNELLEMTEQKYDSEALLQTLLEDYPNLISGTQINPTIPRRWLLIKREMGVPDREEGIERWALDHLFLDQDAIPTLVEVKRSTDSRIRRAVVAQMLEYAANSARYWKIQDIIDSFHETCSSKGLDPDQVLSSFLGPNTSQEDFWELVIANIGQGRIRMLFIADAIPPELQRIVEFLNEQMNPAEVLAMEIKQYTGQNHKTLVSRVIGQTMKAIDGKASRSGRSKVWDKDSVLEQIHSIKGDEIKKIVENLILWCEENGYAVKYGAGAKQGTLKLGFLSESNTFFKFFTIDIGNIWVQFDFLKAYPPFDNIDYRKDLVFRLNKIEGFSFKEDKLDTSTLSKLDGLREEKNFSQFFTIFRWIVQEISQNLKQTEEKSRNISE